MRQYKTYLISYANNAKWYRSQYVLNTTAKGKGVDGVISYNPSNLDNDFKLRHQNFFGEAPISSRGGGFWMWKAMILIQTMNLINEDDCVIYVDSGNAVINDLSYIFETCQQNNIVFFDNRDGNYQRRTHWNKEWTKRDAFVLMDCDEQKYYDAPQIDASYQVYKKCDYVKGFLEEYLKYSENENIISDLPNITLPNLPEYIDHRHDQSILSLMAVKYDIKLQIEPSSWGNYVINRPYPQLFNHHRGCF